MDDVELVDRLRSLVEEMRIDARHEHVWRISETISYYAGKLANLLPAVQKPFVAISGRTRSGKSTLAGALSVRLGVPRASFAAPLKLGCEVMGLREEYRYFWQRIGTDVVRAKFPDHWIKMLEERYPNYQETGLIIDDLRFPNEHEWAKANGFVRVHLDADDQTLIDRGAEPEDLDHDSERALETLDPADVDVLLNATLDMNDQVEQVIEALKRRGFDCSGD